MAPEACIWAYLLNKRWTISLGAARAKTPET